MAEITTEEYKIEVLSKRIGELVSSYESKMADLRIGNTLISQELTTVKEENTNLKEHVRILEENVNVPQEPQAPSQVFTDESD